MRDVHAGLKERMRIASLRLREGFQRNNGLLADAARGRRRAWMRQVFAQYKDTLDHAMPVYTYTTIDDPSATNGSVARGINASGQIVGGYLNSAGGHGFLFSNGTYTTLDDPLAGINGTQAFGINGAGQIVGLYDDAGSPVPQSHGFLLSGGTYTTLDPPGTTFTGA